VRRFLVLALFAVTTMAPPAAAGDPADCDFSGGILNVDINAANVPVTIIRDALEIEVRVPGGQVSCTGGVPTVTTTNTIDVDDDTISNEVRLIISMAGGRFQPGATAEATTPEIEFVVEFPPGSLSQLMTIVGADGRDLIDLGDHGAGGALANLNDDADMDDISFGNVDVLTVRSGDGNDVIDAKEPGFDVPFSTPLLVNGGVGHDRAQAGRGPLTFRGGPTGDLALGGPLRDRLFGGPGNDGVRGHERPDLLAGGTGDDYLGGGQGRDTCRGGSGENRLVSCER
jgi:Ca2+-binding RTX toxin-like protein